MTDPELFEEEGGEGADEATILNAFGENLPLVNITAVVSYSNEALGQVDEKAKMAALLRIDQSSFMTSFRNWWDRRSPDVQQFLLKVPPTVPLFQELINFGFLTEKGMAEKTLMQRQNANVRLVTWGTKLAPLIFVALKPWTPLFEALITLRKTKEELATNSRAYLAQHRQPPQEEQRLAA